MSKDYLITDESLMDVADNPFAIDGRDIQMMVRELIARRGSDKVKQDALIAAVEFGYICCEKGLNINETKSQASKFMKIEGIK